MTSEACEHDWQGDRFGDCNAFDIRCWQWRCSRCRQTAPIRPPTDPEIAALRAQLAKVTEERDARIEPTADRSVMVALSKVLYHGDHGHPRFDSSWLLTELENSLDCSEDDCDTRSSHRYCDKHNAEAMDAVARIARRQALEEAARACEACSAGLRARPLPRTAQDVAQYRIADVLASLIRDIYEKEQPAPVDSGSGQTA